MLVLEQYGVKLKRLEFDDIELVRKWRNQEYVSKNMEYKKKISIEEQVKWFNSINNLWNYYFIIEYNGNKIGVVNVKDVDFDAGFGEGGIFIGVLNKETQLAASFSSLCILNFSFKLLDLTTKSLIKVNKKNKQAIEYNRILGYKLLESRGDFDLYELRKEDYLINSNNLNKAAEKLTGKPDLIFYGNESEINHPSINLLLKNNSH